MGNDGMDMIEELYEKVFRVNSCITIEIQYTTQMRKNRFLSQSKDILQKYAKQIKYGYIELCPSIYQPDVRNLVRLIARKFGFQITQTAKLDQQENEENNADKEKEYITLGKGISDILGDNKYVLILDCTHLEESRQEAVLTFVSSFTSNRLACIFLNEKYKFKIKHGDSFYSFIDLPCIIDKPEIVKELSIATNIDKMLPAINYVVNDVQKHISASDYIINSIYSIAKYIGLSENQTSELVQSYISLYKKCLENYENITAHVLYISIIAIKIYTHSSFKQMLHNKEYLNQLFDILGKLGTSVSKDIVKLLRDQDTPLSAQKFHIATLCNQTSNKYIVTNFVQHEDDSYKLHFKYVNGSYMTVNGLVSPINFDSRNQSLDNLLFVPDLIQWDLIQNQSLPDYILNNVLDLDY